MIMPEDSSNRQSRRRELAQTFDDQRRRRASRSPTSTSVTTNQAGKLCKEIHDEFLVCKICLDSYKSPKCLSCLHTFCEQCIDNHIVSEATYKKYTDYREFTCPLCRKRTQLPVGGVKKLPDNFLVSSLSEMVTRQKPCEAVYCNICKLVSKTDHMALSKCLECNKLLCKSCVEMHRETKVTRNHSLFNVDIQKDVICKVHEEEVVRFYCEPCQMCICVLCTFNEHRDHEVTNFSEAVIKHKSEIETLLNECKVKIVTCENNLQIMVKAEKNIKEVEQKVHDLSIDFISAIRQREKQLIEEIHNLYGKNTIDLIARKSEMQSQLDTLRSTCSLTEVVLQGRDIELLLLKKDVQDKLLVLNKCIVSTMPNSLKKEIRFLAGRVEVGCIQDMDCPLVSRTRPIRSNSCFESNYFDEIVQVQTQCVCTQTDAPVISTKLEKCIQTTQIGRIHRGIATSPVQMVDKSVNTRIRVACTHSNEEQSTGTPDGISFSSNSTAVQHHKHHCRQHRRAREELREEFSNYVEKQQTSREHTANDNLEENVSNADVSKTSSLADLRHEANL